MGGMIGSCAHVDCVCVCVCSALNELEQDIDSSDSKLRQVIRKVDEVLKLSEGVCTSVCMCAWLMR
jgi:hypothetical protein